MFTGIVEDLGEVQAVEQLGDFARIHIRSGVVTADARPGDSICVNGVCLTVTGLTADTRGADPREAAPDAEPAASGSQEDSAPSGFTADVMGETLARSSLKGTAPGTRVNLERSVRLEDRLGGHLVQGHVDGTGIIVHRDPQERWDVVRISLPASLARYVVLKGSIAVDGVSLTVSAVSPSGGAASRSPSGHESAGEDWFEVSLIPETLKRTTLGERPPGSEVNLEVDIIAKYVEKLTGGQR